MCTDIGMIDWNLAWMTAQDNKQPRPGAGKASFWNRRARDFSEHQ